MATEEDRQAARDQLTKLTARYEKAEAQLEQIRKEVSDEIAAILMARTLGPSEVTRLSPFERQHVGRIAKAAGVPPLREPTVISRKAVQRAQAKQSAASVPRRPSPPPKPAPVAEERDGRPLTDEEAKTLAELARSRADDLQTRKLDQDAAQARDAYKDFTVVSSALSMGLLTHDEVYGERPVSGEENNA